MQADAMTQVEERKETVGFGGLGAKLNWLRAAVLGANDGAVSGSGIMIGVAAVDPSNLTAIMVAGIAGLLAGASAMAMGEYVSVSSQRDTEEALIVKARRDIQESPESELEELVVIYQGQGLTEPTARKVAEELSAHDALAAHLRVEYGIHEDELTTPWHAAIASAVSFTSGFLLPIAAMFFSPTEIRIPVTVLAGLIALLVTGYVSAAISESPKTMPILRNVVGGGGAMAVTWIVGHLLGVAVA